MTSSRTCCSQRPTAGASWKRALTWPMRWPTANRATSRSSVRTRSCASRSISLNVRTSPRPRPRSRVGRRRAASRWLRQVAHRARSGAVEQVAPAWRAERLRPPTGLCDSLRPEGACGLGRGHARVCRRGRCALISGWEDVATARSNGGARRRGRPRRRIGRRNKAPPRQAVRATTDPVDTALPEACSRCTKGIRTYVQKGVLKWPRQSQSQSRS